MNKEPKNHKLIIIGNGPAGYSASIYASRYKLPHVIIGSLSGGQITEAHEVCNYPGVSEISGIELAQKMQKQVKDLGGEEIIDEVISLKKESGGFTIETRNSGTYSSEIVLLACGTKRRKLGLPKEEELTGKGLSYCATCDAGFFKDKEVGVVGGSNAATTAALLLSEFAKQVYIIYRGTALRGERMWIDQVKKRKNIEIIFETNVTGLLGEETLTGVKLDREYNNSDMLDLDGLFVEIGSIPRLNFVEIPELELDKSGYIKVGSDQSTSISGLYAAGDITNASNGFRQVITACSEGAIAAQSIYEGSSSKKD